MRNEIVAIAVLVACDTRHTAGDKQAPAAVAQPVSLADGRTIGFIVERAPKRAVASPEALRHYLETAVWPAGTTSELESRKSLSDGFATTFVVRYPSAQPQAIRETHVVRQLGSEWFHCTAAPVLDDAMRDEVPALCRARTRP